MTEWVEAVEPPPISGPTAKHGWLRRARVLILESYWAPLWPRIEYEPARAVERLREVGADTLRFGTVGYWAHFPAPHLRPHPDLERTGRDLLAETVDACHRAGIRVAAYIPVGHWLPPWQAEGRPDWLARAPEGNPMPHRFIGTEGLPELRYVCTSGAYRAAIRDVVAAVAGRYAVDALYFDGPFGDHYGRVCHCDACRRRCGAATGHDLPHWRGAADADWGSEVLWDLIEWRNADGVALLEELVAAARQAAAVNDAPAPERGSRDLPVLINRPSLGHSGLRNRFESLSRAVDGNLVEAGRDFRHKIAVALLTAGTGRPEWNYIGNWGPYPRVFENRRDTLLEGFATVACGGTPAIANGNRVYYDRAGDAWLRELFDFVARAAAPGQALDGLRPAPFAALPYIQTAAERIGGGNAAAQYDAPYHALFATLLDGHVQVCPVPESALDDPEVIGRYPVVLLPNAVCLSGRQIETLRRYVAAGGGLLATHETSLYDERGRRRSDFGLADVLGITYRGTHTAVFDTYLRLLEPWGNFADEIDPAGPGPRPGPGPGALLPQPARTQIALAADALSRGAARTDTAGVDREATVLAESVVGSDVEGAGIVVGRYGRGRTAYLVSDVQCLYQRERERQHLYHRLPDVRRTLVALVAWLGGGRLPFHLDLTATGGGGAAGLGGRSAEGIIGLLAEKRASRVLHLLDWRGPRHEAPHAVVESGAGPIALCVRVRLPPGTTALAVEDVRTQRRLGFSQTPAPGGGAKPDDSGAAPPSRVISFTLPGFDGYAAVVVDLG